LPSATSLTADGAVNFNSGTQTVATLNGSGVVALSGGSLTLSSGSFSGILSGTSSIVKTGASTLILSGADALSGGMLLGAGSLQIAGSGPTLHRQSDHFKQCHCQLRSNHANRGRVPSRGWHARGGTLSASSFTLENGSVSSVLNGSSALTKNTQGIVSLSGANTSAAAPR
jgi:autotransporter-associated beta strand protein